LVLPPPHTHTHMYTYMYMYNFPSSLQQFVLLIEIVVTEVVTPKKKD